MGKNNNKESNAVISAAPKKHKFDPAIVITLVVAVVILAAMISLLLYRNSNNYLKNQKAVTVGTVDVNGVEYSYYYKNTINSFISNYYNYMSYIGLDFNKPLSSQKCAFDSTKTWAEYFEDQATNAIQQVIVLNEEGKKAGFKADEKVDEEVNHTFDEMKNYAESQSMTFEKYIEEMYGKMMTEDNLKTLIKENVYASIYSQELQENYDITDDQINEYYGENKKNFCNASYRIYNIAYTEPTTETESTTEATEATEPTEPTEVYGEAEAKADADSFLNAITDEASFETYALSIMTEDQKKDKAENFTLQKDSSCANLSDDLAEWILDDARQAGDKTVIAGTNSFSVVYFNDAYRDEYKLADARIIYIPTEAASQDSTENADATTPTTEEESAAAEEKAKADAKAKADEALQKWNDGAKTDEAFIALANDYSSEGRAKDGSLYEDFQKNGISDEADEWMYNEAERKEGDVQSFEVGGEYFIVYFKGFGDYYWRQTIIDTLRAEQFKTWYAEIIKSYEVKANSDVIEKVLSD